MQTGSLQAIDLPAGQGLPGTNLRYPKQMKRFILLTLITGSTLLSCSKKSNNPQPQTFTTVTIDGTDYHIVKIGTQTWTTVNYNGTGGVNYNNVSGNFRGSGKLYTYSEATSIPLPNGWRLPTKTDCNKLILYVGGTLDANGNGTASGSTAGKLADPNWAWVSASNSSGFYAYPFGYYNSVTSTFQGTNGDTSNYNAHTGIATYWTSSPITNSTSYGFAIASTLVNNVSVLNAYLDSFQLADRLSVRFVKDN